MATPDAKGVSRSVSSPKALGAVMLFVAMTMGCERDAKNDSPAAEPTSAAPTGIIPPAEETSGGGDDDNTSNSDGEGDALSDVDGNSDGSDDIDSTDLSDGDLDDSDQAEDDPTAHIASVSSLTTSVGTLVPAFDPSVTSYALTVSHRVTDLDFIVVFAGDNALLTVNGSSEAEGKPLTVGDNPFTIIVKSADNSSIVTYQVTVTRARQYAYVTNVDTGGVDSLSLFSINDTTGELEPLSPATAALGADPYDLAVSPDGRHLYVANSLSHTVSMFAIDTATGSLTALDTPTIAQGPVPYAITFHPSGLFGYSANGSDDPDGTVAQYARDPVTGVLSSLSPAVAEAELNPWFLVMEPLGRHLYVTQFGSWGDGGADTILHYEIDQGTGLLSPAPTYAVATEDKPWYVVIDSTGSFVYVGNYGSASVSQYLVNAATGTLTPMATATVAVDSQPVGLAIDPFDRFLYVANSGAGSLNIFAIDAETGALSPSAGGSLAVGGSPYGMMIDKKGRFLYVAKSEGTTVAMYAIDPATGGLTALSNPTVTAGTGPRFIAIAD